MTSVEENLEVISRILTLVDGHPLLPTEDLVHKALTDEMLKRTPAAKIRNELLRLANMRLVERKIIDQEHPLSGSKWKITEDGKCFLDFSKKFNKKISAFYEQAPTSEFETKVVVTMPYELRGIIQKHGEHVISTRDCLELMMRNTSNNIRIATPYFDGTLAFVLDYLGPKASVNILTYETPTEVAANEAKRRLLTRMKQRFQCFECKNFAKYVEGIQIYIPHAKTYISDDKRLIITSANLKQTSLFDNFEMGIYTENPKLVRVAISIFDEVWKNATEYRYS